MNPNYILLAIPFFLLSIAFELVWGRLKKTNFYNFADTLTNLNVGIGSQAFNTLLKLLLLSLYEYIYLHFAFFKLENTLVSFLLCLVVYDFVFYWAHRWGHELNIFWGAHIVHHQSEEYNLSVALRQSWFHSALGFVIFLPIPLLGFNPLVFAGAAAFATLYQFWIHTRHIGKLGPFEWIFNTPSHHRVHHATNAKYLDKNYAAVFILWDRLFGTFCKEEEEPQYGITTPLNSLNPVWANLHFYGDLWQGIQKSPSLKDKVLLPFRGPAYLGNLIGHKAVVPRSVETNKAPAATGKQVYVFVQFVVLLWGLVSYLSHFNDLPVFYKLTFFGIIALTTLNCGAILENRKWVFGLELIRFVIFLLLYNTYYLHYHIQYLIYTVSGSALLVFACAIWISVNEGRIGKRSLIE